MNSNNDLEKLEDLKVNFSNLKEDENENKSVVKSVLNVTNETKDESMGVNWNLIYYFSGFLFLVFILVLLLFLRKKSASKEDEVKKEVKRKVFSMEHIYERENDYFGAEPAKILVKAEEYLKTDAQVLDLGCGQGRNALYFARKGYFVQAVEIAKSGLKVFIEKSLREKLNTHGFFEDIRDFKFVRKYDLIYSYQTLNYLEKKEAREVIEKMKQNTNLNGLNVVAVYTKKNPNKKLPCLFKSKELKKMYKKWEILHYRELLTPIEAHGVKAVKHRHYLAVIIARKKY